MKRTVQMANAGIPKSKPGAPVPFKKVGTKGAPKLNVTLPPGLPAITHGLMARFDWTALNSYVAKQQADKKARAARFMKLAA
jgi:hypothetical protein